MQVILDCAGSSLKQSHRSPEWEALPSKLHTGKLRLRVGKDYVVQTQALKLAFWTFQFRTFLITTILFCKDDVCISWSRGNSVESNTTTSHCRTNKEHIPQVSILPWPFPLQTPGNQNPLQVSNLSHAYKPGRQTMAHGPNVAHCLTLQIKFYWNMLICLLLLSCCYSRVE